ncbi:MAG: hypothetical protein QOI76_1556 [Frankiales bacterium]|nr:hypothetical protein [Frankiales bacterium]
MRKLKALTGVTGMVVAVALCAPASGQLAGAAQVTARTMGPLGIGCVDAAASFTGRAYCLDGNHRAALTGLAGSAASTDFVRQQGIKQLDGWQVPTRCDGNGTSGKRIQLVYVHVKGGPSIFKASLPFILQRLVPGANGVFEHSSKGKRAVRWVTKKQAGGCVPTVITATVAKSANVTGFPFSNIGRALQKASAQLGRTDRAYLVLVDTPDHPFGYPFSDCGFGNVASDARTGAVNRSNSGPSYAMVWVNCWTGLIAAHEITHTMGAVQPVSPHHTDEGHCWDGKDAMCYDDGSKQKQKLICKKPDDFRLLDCNGDDYFSLSPKRGSYLATHWNSADSAFLIRSKAKVLPTAPVKPASMTVDVVDDTHLRVSWTAGPVTKGAVTSWTVAVSPPDGGAYRPPTGVLISTVPHLTVVGARVRALVVKVTHNVTQKIGVYATNVSGDGPEYGPVVAGVGSPPSPIVATYQGDTVSGYLQWTGGQSDQGLTTCTAVLVNGKRIDQPEPGDTLENTTDPNGRCFSDSPFTQLTGLAQTDVLEVYARNAFGVTRVTVDHPPPVPYT